MAISCDVNVLAQQAKCFKCNSPATLAEIQTYLLCQILNNGTGGGGGLPTGPQTANTFLAGPTSGEAASPTFRQMVTADLGTTLTPQFASVGIGVAASNPVTLANAPLTVFSPVNAGSVNIANFNCAAGGVPVLTIGVYNGPGAFLAYINPPNQLAIGVYGGFGDVLITNTGDLSAQGNISTVAGGISANSDVASLAGNVVAQVGVFQCQGQSGISQTFDIGGGNTQITFVGGIATLIA